MFILKKEKETNTERSSGMKKRVVFGFLLGFAVIALAACRADQDGISTAGESSGNGQSSLSQTEEGTDAQASQNEAADSVQTEIQEGQGSNVLIAYFSLPEDVETTGVDAVAGASVVVKDGEKLGNTEYVARLIQQTIGGDLFAIETVDAYPLDHDPLVDHAAEEQDENFRPELAAHVENFERYEYVFLGFPNWWGDMPMPVYSFLEEYDFGAKTIIPFITHGGSGASRTLDTISQIQPGALLMTGDELILSRNQVAESEETVAEWARGLGINAEAALRRME